VVITNIVLTIIIMTTTIAIISNNMIIINHARVPKILWAQATAIPFQPGMTAFFTRTMMGPQPGAGMGEEKSLGGMVGGWIYGQLFLWTYGGFVQCGYPKSWLMENPIYKWII
jgi:hypothetical protein